jgi:hypothetical protein
MDSRTTPADVIFTTAMRVGASWHHLAKDLRALEVYDEFADVLSPFAALLQALALRIRPQLALPGHRPECRSDVMNTFSLLASLAGGGPPPRGAASSAGAPSPSPPPSSSSPTCSSSPPRPGSPPPRPSCPTRSCTLSEQPAATTESAAKFIILPDLFEPPAATVESAAKIIVPDLFKPTPATMESATKSTVPDLFEPTAATTKPATKIILVTDLSVFKNPDEPPKGDDLECLVGRSAIPRSGANVCRDGSHPWVKAPFCVVAVAGDRVELSGTSRQTDRLIRMWFDKGRFKYGAPQS